MPAPDIHLLSVGTALPGPPVDNATLVRRLKVPAVWEQWIDTFIGTHNRHFAVDLETGAVHTTLTDLGVSASTRALAAAGLDSGDIDFIVLGTASPEMLMPTTVNMIADRLGIDNVPTYQLQSGCTGAIQALDVAQAMLTAGPARTALVIGADSCAKHIDLSLNFESMQPSEQVNGVLFGDGAGAAVLSTRPARNSAVIRQVYLRLVGMNREPGQSIEWYGRADRNSDRPAVSEDYKAIEESVPKMAVEVLHEVLDHLDWDESDVDYLLPPQLSGRMTARIRDALELPRAQEVSCVAETGNTGNALPFLQLERALPRMSAGDRALAIAIESSKWIKAGIALEKV
ncbi:3-oxoacyl-ACP synthase III family protein [Dactylosporangium sp. NPDC051541]|uniref:3-oxoacyl-ACP synthase III family protein n=1 Tax=Dactylosporangium sp. NPDC051541 TaxID=3363977 RepID=UPI00378FFB3A